MKLFEMIRRGHAAGQTIRQLATKHKVHHRMVRQALDSAIPPERKRAEREQDRIEYIFHGETLGRQRQQMRPLLLHRRRDRYRASADGVL